MFLAQNDGISGAKRATAERSSKKQRRHLTCFSSYLECHGGVRMILGTHPHGSDQLHLHLTLLLIRNRNKMQQIWTLLSGWWYTYPSEKYEFVSWDGYSQYMENMFQTTDQLSMINHKFIMFDSKEISIRPQSPQTSPWRATAPRALRWWVGPTAVSAWDLQEGSWETTHYKDLF